VALRRLTYRVGYRCLRLVGAIFRLRMRGVKCVILRGEEVLLVRHTYGDRRRWELPGGAIKRGESPRRAAAREVREELGVAIEDWRELGDVVVRSSVRNERLSCFTTRVGKLELELDPGEIAEARWFARSELPARRGAGVKRFASLTS
jgi:8-oxo-dGTP pyrophosphatase MutT (NUDIX family)